VVESGTGGDVPVAVAAPGGRRRRGAVLQHRGRAEEVRCTAERQNNWVGRCSPGRCSRLQTRSRGGTALGDLAEEEGARGGNMGVGCDRRLLKRRWGEAGEGVSPGVPRGGGRRREGGGGSAWGWLPDHEGGMASGGDVRGDSALSRRRRADEQGRVVGRG
jgi:hypothetical protein